MDNNLQDMEKLFEDMDLDFLDEELLDDEEVKEAMKILLEEMESDDTDSQ